MRYRLVLITVVTLLVVSAIPAGETLDRLLASHQELATTPQGAVKVWLAACFAYMDEMTRDEARAALQQLTIPFRDDPEWDRRPSARFFTDRLADPAYQHIFRSYAAGAAPENAYEMDPTSWELVVTKVTPRAGGGTTVFIRSGGADSPRPVVVRRSTTSGLYYVDTFSSVYVGIRPPVKPGEERFE